MAKSLICHATYWELNVPGTEEAKPSKISLRAQKYLQQGTFTAKR